MTASETLTALEIAKVACDIEADGIAFYRAAADTVLPEAVQALFRDLAQQEAEHLSTFRQIYKQLDERMGGAESTVEFLFDDDITGYLRSISQGNVFPEDVDADALLSGQPSVRDVLDFALGAEKKSILLYSEIVSHNAFAYSEEILSRIIKEEKVHIVRLTRQLDDLD